MRNNRQHFHIQCDRRMKEVGVALASRPHLGFPENGNGPTHPENLSTENRVNCARTTGWDVGRCRDDDNDDERHRWDLLP
mmetsp:Transcript_33142/g.70656  ORF Transcript_33142/g.70656 Transcript_33142/m.70656 type:complete len:80 (-) Transcript_33142:1489-1728(-)